VITGIIVALPEELRSLTTKKITKGQLGSINDSVLVACSGAGAENASRAAQLLVANGATALISWGCAAALSAQLRPGDLALVDQLIAADGERLQLDSSWLAALKSLLPSSLTIQAGSLVESKQLVSSSIEKQQIHTHTQAIALDMESVAIARVAREHALPMLVLRAIADPVNMDLPRSVAHALNAEGEVVLSRLLRFLIAHPSELPGLIQLGRHFRAAKKTLATVAKQLDGIVTFNVTNSGA